MPFFDVKAKWTHVSKTQPCPVCKKPDWCVIGERWINCMRVTSDKTCKNGGWLHPINGEFKPVRPIEQWKPSSRPNFTNLMERWQLDTLPMAVTKFAEELGVHHTALYALGCAWSRLHMAWAFPMVDGNRNIIGIRLRNHEGRKWAVKGSQQGLFVPSSKPDSMAFVCEGPTDAAAALSLGFYAVGRPSCLGGTEHLKTLFRSRHVQRAVLLADNDEPGIRGAERLAVEIGLPCALLILPAKDVRAFVQAGGTRLMVEAILHDTIWRHPKRP